MKDVCKIKSIEIKQEPYNPKYITGSVSKNGIVSFEGTDNPKKAFSKKDIKEMLK